MPKFNVGDRVKYLNFPVIISAVDTREHGGDDYCVRYPNGILEWVEESFLDEIA